jgi:hypothetical protein
MAVACRHPATKPLPTSSASASAPSSAPALGAFDLTSTETGAALIGVDGLHAGLWLTALDALGRAAMPQTLYDGKASDARQSVAQISEVAAASLGDQLDVIWVEKSAQGAHARRPAADVDRPRKHIATRPECRAGTAGRAARQRRDWQQ